MDSVTHSKVTGNPDKIIWIMPLPGVAVRLARALAETGRELSAGPLSYLRAALLPDHAKDWFPLRFAGLIGASLAHPIESLRGAVAGDEIDIKRRRRLKPILSVSATIHGALIVYLAYMAFLSPFAHVRVVNKAYRKFDPNVILAKLYYPAQVLRQAHGQTMTLEEIRERAKKRREAMEKAREQAEKEKKEKEEADRKAAEDAAKAAQNKPTTPAKFGEINEAPIKDTIGKIYELYQAGGLDIPEMKFSVMAGFKVEPDGSLSDIRIMPDRSSGSKVIDRKALEILWNIGESHALGPVSDLSSATISLEITNDLAKLRITAFAPTPEIAKAKSDLLNVLFWALRMKQRSPEVSQLLSMVRVKSDGKRVDTILTVPRARAAEMLRVGFEKPSNPPQ